MNIRVLVFLSCSSVTGTLCSFGQDSTTHGTVFPGGIAAQFDAGYLAMRDEHLSDEKYSGPSSGFTLEWSRFHETYGFRIGMAYEKASHIRNYNVSAEVTQAAFTLVNLYPIGRGDLFGNDLFAFLGPAAEAFTYYRMQNIAQNSDASPNVYQSGAWLFSLGIRAEVILLFKGGFQVESALQVSLLSFGGGTGNETNSSTAITVLTPVAGMRGRGEIGLRYYLPAGISVAAGYRLEVTRIDSWNFILAGTDIGFVSLGYHF